MIARLRTLLTKALPAIRTVLALDGTPVEVTPAYWETVEAEARAALGGDQEGHA